MPIVKVGWTLNYEMFFYIFFAAAIVMVSSSIWRTVLLYCAFIGLILFVSLVGSQPDAVRYFCDPILFEFILGCFVANLYMSDRFNNMPCSICRILIAFGTALLFCSSIYDNSFSNRLLDYGVPATLIVMGFIGLEHCIIKDNWNSKLWRFLGDASVLV